VKRIENHEEFTKARFAQELAYALAWRVEMQKDLVSPEYIKQAIRWVVNGEEPKDTHI
jgi:hypothetical protein